MKKAILAASLPLLLAACGNSNGNTDSDSNKIAVMTTEAPMDSAELAEIAQTDSLRQAAEKAHNDSVEKAAAKEAETAEKKAAGIVAEITMPGGKKLTLKKGGSYNGGKWRKIGKAIELNPAERTQPYIIIDGYLYDGIYNPANNTITSEETVNGEFVDVSFKATPSKGKKLKDVKIYE